MPIDKELLDILCCPKTKVDVELLSDTDLTRLNNKIAEGNIKQVDGKKVNSPLKEALITIDRKTVYPIDEGIPVMLIDMGIPFEQVQ